MLDMASRNKTRIAQQFSRAAATYNSAADVQLDIAFEAMAQLTGKYQCGLDIGCGTGRISQQLAPKCERLLGMDLAFGMLDYAKQDCHTKNLNIDWLQGDADNLPIADDSVDLIFSSMVLQWSDDPQKVMAEIARVMAHKSTAVLAIMCQGSFEQLNASWQSVDDQRHVNHFASANTWLEAALAQGLQVNMQEKAFLTWHTNIRQLLTSIKSIGANVVLNTESNTDEHKPSNKSLLNRHTLQNLEDYYQQKFAKNLQLPLTYQVCFLHCIK
jgi:malonyl-CoA O-methyltransferase